MRSVSAFKRFSVGGLGVVVLLAGCQALGEQMQPQPPKAPAPVVRIGLMVDTTTVVVTSASRFTIAGVDGAVLAQSEPGESWTFRAEALMVRASSSSGRGIGPVGAPVRVNTADSGLISIGGKNYRGSALLRTPREGRITAINVVGLEDYMRGVVQFEIGRLTPNLIEAVKAQAIAARTYAIGNLNRWNDRGFDFYATVLDQVYGGAVGEDSVTTRAVLETAGEIVTYDGKPILAYYSSTCGGRTSAVSDSWTWRADLPYLKSVPDTMGSTGRAYCETSNRYRWTVSWAREALRDVLGETLGARAKGRLPITRANPADRMSIQRVEAVEVTGLNQANRARTVRIRVDGHTHELPGDSIRWVLRPEAARILNSSMLIDVKTEMADGVVERLEVQGGGWGHGVGMCQVGAINRARAGQSYRQILSAYYSGTEIQRLY